MPVPIACVVVVLWLRQLMGAGRCVFRIERELHFAVARVLVSSVRDG